MTHVLLLDNFDSFTHMLQDYLKQIGLRVVVCRNNVSLSELIKLEPKALIISPGPERPENAGVLLEALHHFHDKIPVLGVCLGHQAIGEYFGMQLIKADRPMHGKLSELSFEEHEPMYTGEKELLKVVRYNSLVLSGQSPELIVTAKSEKGEVMALRHKNLPIWGVQYHPEAVLTENGLSLLRRWKTLIEKEPLKHHTTS